MTDKTTGGGEPMEIFATNASLNTITNSTATLTTPQKPEGKKDRARMALAIVGFILSVAIIIIGAVIGAEAKKRKGSEVIHPSFRLPKTLRPIEYEVRLQPFVNGNFSIHGQVQVEMEVIQVTRNITLHLADIITHNETVQVKVYSSKDGQDGEGRLVGISRHEYNHEKEWYVAYLTESLHPQDRVILSMQFTGLLNDKLRGFYRSSYTAPDGRNATLAVSFFSPTHARRAFPCLDEPALKAKFKISLAKEENMTALSNMPIQGIEPVSGQDGWEWVTFNTTVEMSTYLVAFVISDFKNLTHDNFSVWGREEVMEEAAHALEVAPKMMSFFEEYLNVSYQLPKIDLIAIPDFAAGAMENWGLITFREESLLLPKLATASGQQRVEVVIAHELAHQWFGNLVTASWWTEILLKEGMAAYMENLGTDALNPEWHMMDQTLLTMQGVMVSDGLSSTHPVNQPVSRPSDIGQIFDSITYSKGVSVIRMLSYILTQDTFRRGLTHYLNKYAYSSASQDEFWDILTEVGSEEGRLPASVTVKDIMDTWTLQSGYPVVTVSRSDDGHSATLTQERFLLAGNITEEEGKCRWWVPLSYTSADNPDFTKTPPKYWMPANETKTVLGGLPAKEDWIVFNLKGTGYFRVNYDEDNWARLTDQLSTNHTDIETVTRALILDDALSLARAGHLPYQTALGIITYLEAEKEYVPWSSALSSLSYLEQMLTRTPSYGNLRRYLLKLLNPLYHSIGFEDDLNDSHLNQLQRSQVVGWVCKLGLEECVTKAVKEFEAWMTNDTQISPNIKSTVYCVGVAEGGEEAWDGVWRRYQKTEMPREKLHLLDALGCSREIWILSRYLDLAFTEGSSIRKQDINRVFSSVAGNDLGKNLAWNFLRSEWNRIVDYYDTFSSAASLITSATKEFNTRFEKRELEQFYEDNKESLKTSSRAMKTAIERTDSNIVWMEKYYEIINKWLQEEEEDDDDEVV